MKRLMTALLFLFPPAIAMAEGDYGTVDYLYGWQNPDGSYQTAIAIDLNAGWKTYWRVPGPAGIPPEFDWSQSQNVGNVSWSWPTPKVFYTNGMMSIGYTGSLVVPVTITPKDPTQPIDINVNVAFGVCADICIPAAARLEQHLSPNATPERTSEIQATLRDVPLSADHAGLRNAACKLTPSRRGFNIEANLNFARELTGGQQLVIEYRNPDIWIAAADTTFSGRDLTGVTEIQYYGSGMLSVDRSQLRVTLIQDRGAFEFMGCPAG